MATKSAGKTQGAPYKFPDPDDRSPNEPTYVAKVEQVLGIFNRGKKENDKALRVTKTVRDWFLNEAKNQSWDKAWFAGSECILENTTVESCKKNDK